MYLSLEENPKVTSFLGLIMGGFINMKTRLQLILLPFGDPESLSRTSLLALLVTGMMKYPSTVKNC